MSDDSLAETKSRRAPKHFIDLVRVINILDLCDICVGEDVYKIVAERVIVKVDDQQSKISLFRTPTTPDPLHDSTHGATQTIENCTTSAQCQTYTVASTLRNLEGFDMRIAYSTKICSAW